MKNSHRGEAIGSHWDLRPHREGERGREGTRRWWEEICMAFGLELHCVLNYKKTQRKVKREKGLTVNGWEHDTTSTVVVSWLGTGLRATTQKGICGTQKRLVGFLNGGYLWAWTRAEAQTTFQYGLDFINGLVRWPNKHVSPWFTLTYYSFLCGMTWENIWEMLLHNLLQCDIYESSTK